MVKQPFQYNIATELYPLNELIAWYLNYISVKLVYLLEWMRGKVVETMTIEGIWLWREKEKEDDDCGFKGGYFRWGITGHACFLFFFFGKILFIYWDAWVAKSVKPMGQVMIPGPRDGAPCQGTSFSLSLLLMVSLTISLSQINKMFKKVFFIWEKECERVWMEEGRGREQISRRLHAGSIQGLISPPWDHDMSRNEESDA